MAVELDFQTVTANSIDATSDRDFALEFVNALSLLALHLSRWAEEMILFSSQEFGFIHLPEAYSTGSSAMPQKKNPDLPELTRAKAARVIGAASALMITIKGLPLAYNKDLQATQEPLFDASDTVLTLLPLVTGWIKIVEFNYQRMLEATSAGFMNAWAAATYLTKRGVPSRLAHELIGKAVRLALENKCELQNLPLDQLRQLSPAFDQDFADCLKLDAVLAIHDVIGGTAPARVRNAVSEAKQRIDSLLGEVHANS